MRRFALLAALLTVGAPVSAMAGDVAGKVYDQRGAPAAGVELALGAARTVSAADGSYAFADVAAGEHMLAAGRQRVAVSVTELGETRRNLFLLSTAARRVVTGAPVDHAALDATIALAETMLRESAMQGDMAWRWNDLEG